MPKLTYLSFIFLCFLSCSKSQVEVEPTTSSKEAGFIKYTIAKGQQFCNDNAFVATSYGELKFIAKFDSSAIYSTKDPGNQDDINKLYGFSDNKTTHHNFSARFGWRWSNGALRLFGYIYNSSLIDSKELGIIAIGKENDCAIKVTSTSYQFFLNGKIDSLPRESSTVKAEGYKLYPYFGGDELAPHAINIFIKEL